MAFTDEQIMEWLRSEGLTVREALIRLMEQPEEDEEAGYMDFDDIYPYLRSIDASRDKT